MKQIQLCHNSLVILMNYDKVEFVENLYFLKRYMYLKSLHFTKKIKKLNFRKIYKDTWNVFKKDEGILFSPGVG